MLYERELTAMTATVCAYNAYTESNKARVLNHVVAENGQIDMDRTRLTVYYIVIPTPSQYIYIYMRFRWVTYSCGMMVAGAVQ